MAAGAVAVGEFPQQRDRLGVLRAHLRAAGQLVHDRQPLGILTVGRPQIQGGAQRAGRVPVGVDRVVPAAAAATRAVRAAGRSRAASR
jgi:hypothetical protein